MSTLFLAQAAYSSIGGIERFNRRVIDALTDHAPRRAHLLNDRAADLPTAASGLRAFDGDRLAFVVRTLSASREAEHLLLGHINLLPLGWLAKRLNPRLRLTLFAHGVEVWNDPPYRRRRPYEPFLLASIDTVAAVSHHTAERMHHAFGVPRAKCVILPNAVDGPLAAPAESRSGPLLAVSRMDAHDRAKNLDTVIRALATLDHGARLEIVGDGVLRPELEALARALGIADRVGFLGRLDDAALAACYARAGAFVLPSGKEGFGIVYLEAWRHGLPVICANAGAAPELVADGIDGFVVEPGDIQALADRMAALLVDPRRAAAIGRAGAAKVAAKYRDTHFRANLAALLEAK